MNWRSRGIGPRILADSVVFACVRDAGFGGRAGAKPYKAETWADNDSRAVCCAGRGRATDGRLAGNHPFSTFSPCSPRLSPFPCDTTSVGFGRLAGDLGTACLFASLRVEGPEGGRR